MGVRLLMSAARWTRVSEAMKLRRAIQDTMVVSLAPFRVSHLAATSGPWA